ncbi:MAG TPA: tRNA uridine(34) 5-carboxymethylaminomethyl modification radical SAM/GNAT enzyme Elp3 [Anaerolineales bacterium]|nr:tRNA uridine(34) 5-carboxymethylaminomethyl modification radical SAM/GNAT enzyme Elp3 [Anaerolineales bacterium]
MVKKLSFQDSIELTPEKLALARHILDDVRAGQPVMDAVRQYPIEEGYISKFALVAAYHQLIESGEWKDDPALLATIRLKPVRTLSGVTTVTVLTKPYPCPGKCIFCPDDVRMPKSYLPDEPGAMRALEHNFDPYTQVKSRLEALDSVGHPTDKVELLILGGTFSSYRRDYQAWFVQRCFEAMNAIPPEAHAVEPKGVPLESLLDSLDGQHRLNESAIHRNVGLSVETRPDEITPDELAWFRALGVTKVQIGVQSLDDRILEINKRGHTVAEAHQAVAMLRAGGFKIVLHWMPNLLGATPESDREDFPRLWEGLCPDEIKIYPCQLLENAELYNYWQRGEYHPYTQDELVNLIADVKPSIPHYCRVNRVIRDIPSTHVVEGNRRTSLRQDVQLELARRGTRCNCIRCREVRGEKVELSSLRLDDLAYPADGAEEHFLSYITPEDRIAGFLRLSLPGPDSPATGLADLNNAAIIREVHVYGQSLPVGAEQAGAAQHTGLGTRLMAEAERIARAGGYARTAVIAAVGTRQYYLERGFERGELYLVKK